MPSQDDVAKKLQQLIESQSNFQLGKLTSSASTGGLVTAVLPNGSQVTAKAGNDCSGGECSLFRLEDGSYIAMSGNASQLVSKQTTTYRKSTPSENLPTGKYLKVLFSKVENTKRVFYIGGDREAPLKIHEAESAVTVKAAYISCTGEGKDKWMAAMALQDGVTVTIWHITAKESEKKSWTDTKGEIFPLLTYNGFGTWSAGTFIAPTMDQSETTQTTGETQITTTTYTVNRPSFVTGSGEVRDVNFARSRTIKKAEVCYKTVMRSGACVPGPMINASYVDTPTVSLGTFGNKGFWQSVKNYWDDWRYRNPGRFDKRDPGVTQAFVDNIIPIEQMPPRPTTLYSSSNPSGYTYYGGLYSGIYSWKSGANNWSLTESYPFYYSYLIDMGLTGQSFGQESNRLGVGYRQGTPTVVNFMTAGPPICDPPFPSREVTPCPNQSYNDTIIPGTKTREISGGYALNTKSFLINRGEYSELPGQIRLVASGSGAASGSTSIVMTTNFTYGYSGTNWLDRTNTATCQSQDSSVQVDVQPAELKSSEEREVCLAVGIGENDRITFKYTQADNDRKEEIYRNGVKLNTPIGFALTLKGSVPTYSSPTPFATKSEYVGTNKYLASPPYSMPVSALEGCPVVSIKPPEYSLSPSSFASTKGTISGITANAPAAVGGGLSNFVTLQSLTLNTNEADKEVVSGASILTGSATQGQLASPLIMSLNGVAGLLALPDGYCNLDDPYTRSISTVSNMPDYSNKYQSYLLNVVRPLGNPAFCFYTDGKIMVSAFPDSDAGYCYRKDKAAILTGKFGDDNSFTWGKIETRDVLPLGRNREDTTFVVHSTSAWF